MTKTEKYNKAFAQEMATYVEALIDDQHPVVRMLMNQKIEESSGWDFFIGSPHHYFDPFLLPDIFAGVEILSRAIHEGKRIAIFGDKDVDGITAIVSFSRLLVSMLSPEYPFSYTVLFDDDKEADYGLTKKIVDQAGEKKCDVLVALDTGTSDFEALRHARNLGLETIVLDHHEQKDELPEADALINPKRLDSAYPFSGLSTAGLVFKFFHALLFLSSVPRTIFIDTEADNFHAEYVHSSGIYGIENKEQLKVFLEDHFFSVSSSFKYSDGSGKIQLKFIVSGSQRKEIHKTLEAIFSEFNQTRSENEVKFGFQVELWNNLLLHSNSIMHSGLAAANDFSKIRMRGIDMWGNPLTLFDPTRVTEKFFDIFGEEAGCLSQTYSLRFHYLILQMSTSEKIYKRLYNVLPLIAIGTLADMMPLEQENRLFVRTGIYYLRHNIDKTLQNLINYLGLVGPHLRSRNISWSLTPLLNSPGRIGSGVETLEYLLSINPSEQWKNLENLFSLNQHRKKLIEEGKNLAISRIEKKHEKSILNDGLVATILDGIPVGLSGLIASRIADHYQRAAVVIIENGERATGSSRSYKNQNVLSMVEDSAEDLLMYGGHQEASGFTFESGKTEIVLKNFLRFAKKEFLEEDEKKKYPESWFDSEERYPYPRIPIQELNPEFLMQMDWLEPFGVGNDEPLFYVYGIRVDNYKKIGKNREHVKIIWENPDRSNHYGFSPQVEILAWGMAKEFAEIFVAGREYDIIAEVDLNFFRKELRLNLFVREFVQ